MANKKDRPKYLVLKKWGNFEIRQYEPRIIAEIAIQKDFEQATKEGFNLLAAYIFGQNATKSKISMTAPVEQREDVTQKNWLIAFNMPTNYKITDLPSPKNSRITLKQIEAQKRATLIFSGFYTEKKAAQNKKLLLELIEQHGYSPTGPCTLARYDPPWTLPCFRHNELLFVIH
ncbi:SOUL family heme-binding protein [Candidatus Rhabdochlamydia porcellionis]|uniref:SOUL family heme-binding protein n=1 Tax=Candidatus Rhabdochlamydia porcellionis TaxID=225148 RepID=UPI001890BEA9|nr:heme-binding protein [Candidatus Rhabdochlamydia porcellionis]